MVVDGRLARDEIGSLKKCYGNAIGSPYIDFIFLH
jgi:hypothetical protein